MTGATVTAAPGASATGPRSWPLVDEVRPERRPADAARCVIGALGVLLAAMWAHAGGTLDINLYKVVSDLPDALDGVANVFNALGSIWFALLVVVLLLVRRRIPAARDAALAGVGAWLLAIGIDDITGTRSAASLGIHVRTGTGPTFPAATVAVAAALTVAVGPYLIRPLRRTVWLLVGGVALSAMYLGSALASDALGGLFLGLVAGAAVHVAFGAPGGRPTTDEIRDALTTLGFEVVSIDGEPYRLQRATVMDFTVAGGGCARVVAFGRDQRDGQFAAKVWHALMYKTPGLPVFGTRLQQAEHLAYALLLAEQAGVHVPHVLKTGVAGDQSALLVTDAHPGRRLSDLGDSLSDAVLTSTWTALDLLHAAGITHGDLNADRMLLRDDGTVAFSDLGVSQITTDTYWRDRDIAALLVATAALVGNERAVAAAVDVFGKERVAATLPLVQPAALPASARHGAKHLGKTLKQLRTDVAAATGTEDVTPLKVKRLSLVDIGMLAGIGLAVAIAIVSLGDVDWASVQHEFAHAAWGWVLLTVLLYPLVPMAWATALMGCVNVDLPFGPTTLVQLACSFLNLITPNGIGGTALQIDYLRHEGVPLASGGAAMVLSTGVGGAIQMVLFLTCAALTATTVASSNSGGSIGLGAVAVGGALVGVVLFVPKIRGKVLPTVKRTAGDVWAVVRNPKKGALLFGGDTAGNLIYPALLGLCLLAFGQSLGFAQLVVVQVGAGMLGNVAPVPGGIGVQEAALTSGLTAFGIAPNPALAAVLAFRAATFLLPPIAGFFTLRWIRGHGYA
ncbi:MAG TPA: lysylphosphatidylglycerol synthase transmembrane domain-containing protein [Acidimicrobiia bacterium]